VTRIIVLSTGGTIASRYSAQHRSVVSNVGGGELVASLGSLAPDAEVIAEEFSNIGSYSIDLETAFRLAHRIRALLSDPGISGVVVTHGTDTMEESAYLADLVIDSAKPVVFTGAQLHADEPDSDGPRNLADAIRVAASENANGLGVVIAFGQEIHAARDATKMHASRVGTFASLEHGKLGEIDAGRVWIHRRTIRRDPIVSSRIEPQVDVIKLVMGSDERFVKASVEIWPWQCHAGRDEGRCRGHSAWHSGCSDLPLSAGEGCADLRGRRRIRSGECRRDLLRGSQRRKGKNPDGAAAGERRGSTRPPARDGTSWQLNRDGAAGELHPNI
jgi:hypothetical protein